MVNKFLWAQMEKRNPKDWTTTILKDIEELNLKLTEEIKKHESIYLQQHLKECN